MRQLTEVYLSLEGFEALRLADSLGLKHEEAARRMEVSRQTFGRVLAGARRCVADALVNGRALHIQGGDYVLSGRLGATDTPVDETRDQRSAVGGGALKGQTQTTAAQTPILPGKEHKVEKIVVTSEGPGLDEPVDPRFGRAAGFVVVDPETLEFEYVDNGAGQAMGQGAGIQAAETVARTGAKVVLTGFVGPKAFQALTAAGIVVGQSLQNLSVREAIARFKKGEVDVAQQPSKMGHWK
jgi:predicted DNA-binding protein (UPF0251 family)/predicted Fe-Mo cluster-binding NifX family protein